MRRIATIPRDNWQQKVEAAGLIFHTPEGEGGGASPDRPYWDESAEYQFEAEEIDKLEAAANVLQDMCLEAAQHVVDKKRYAELGIPAAAIPAIEWAWVTSPPALYGRFDISYNGVDPPKLLEYNADTPTALLEAAVIQWAWLEEQHPNCDQFNSIHERLIAKWQDIAPYVSKPVYFAGLDNAEDQLTLAYLRDTAEQAELPTVPIMIEDLGWNESRKAFVDMDERQIFTIFKLYPWEMMLTEEFGPAALETYKDMRWIEPIWKMLFSNKGLLPILWEMYPGHELLLESHFDGGRKNKLKSYVKKPLHSREGSNITMVRDGKTIASTEGPYTGPQIVQALAPEAVFPDNLKRGAKRYPVCGLWMIDQTCCGLGIRESGGPITGNLSSFVPHYFC
ncbi:MAG: glutathionylspermidine synthase family protein [Edaphobacter sp.]|uniref:glutathionylspermidine synthase family protein n=1 Tax=Edaphobacter sp. TaxID=1934404 RepID=UPI002384EA56|nr:glutathionylspermidine synthase family protein [Edaphobacter sp.]MDE1178530.1 glutathionylspermidine synthase family protein [Edaphobacter sp.]